MKKYSIWSRGNQNLAKLTNLGQALIFDTKSGAEMYMFHHGLNKTHYSVIPIQITIKPEDIVNEM